MLQIQLDDEFVFSFWDRLACEFQELASPSRPLHSFLEIAGSLVTDKLANDPMDVFESVTAPTGRAGEHTLGLRFSRSIERDLALAAKDFFGLVSH